MTKQEIIKKFSNCLKDKSKYFEFIRNNYFTHVKAESIFQFFIREILVENGYTVICNNHESKKSAYESYLAKYIGNDRGISDLFVTTCKESLKGAYLELKSGYDKVYKVKGGLKKSETLTNQNDFIERMKKEGYTATFLYPENTKIIFKSFFNIEM